MFIRNPLLDSGIKSASLESSDCMYEAGTPKEKLGLLLERNKEGWTIPLLFLCLLI